MTILIADQNPEFRSTVKKHLEADEKVRTVWEADDGEKAVELARKLQPDLVLMDMSLPLVNGLEATQIIKKTESNVQVIIMGEYTEPVYRRAAIRSGADDFISKSSARAGNIPSYVSRRP